MFASEHIKACPKHATLHYPCAIPQAPIRLQGSSAVAAAGALGDWTLEGAPDLIEAMNVSRQIFRMSTHWLLESQTMTWTWIIFIYIFHNFRNIPEICPESTSIYHQRCNMTNPRSYDYLQKRNKFYTNSIMGPTVGPWQTHLPPRHGAPGAMPPAGSEAICIITSRGMHPFPMQKWPFWLVIFCKRIKVFKGTWKTAYHGRLKAKSMEVPSLICLQLHTCQEKI